MMCLGFGRARFPTCRNLYQNKLHAKIGRQIKQLAILHVEGDDLKDIMLTLNLRALDWDRFKCVLTKFVYGLDVSHIVPLKVNKITVKEQEQEWTLLGLVWSKERVNRWREAMMTGESHEAGMVTERLENLITLDAPVHIFWAMLNVLFILSRSTRIRPIWKFLSTGCLVLGL